MDIKVTFAELANTSGDITTASNKIEGCLGDLKGRVDKVLAGYTGESSEAFSVAQKNWTEAATDLQQVLNQIGVAVRAAGEAYEAAERKNASRW